MKAVKMPLFKCMRIKKINYTNFKTLLNCLYNATND